MKSRKLNRRDFLRFTAIAAGGAVAAACGAAPTPQVIEKEVVVEKEVPVEKVVTATPVPVEEGVDVEVLGAGRIVLNQWDGIGAADGLILTELLKGFTRENPEVSVKRQIMGWGTYFDKLAAALVAGSGGPDVFVLWHSVMPQYAKAGHLYPAAQGIFSIFWGSPRFKSQLFTLYPQGVRHGHKRIHI